MFVQLCIQLLLLISPALISGSLIAKEGCVDKCGSLSIPYPFGLGSNCSRPGSSYNLICNTSTDPPKVYFVSGIEIVEITTSYVRINFPYLVARACYNVTVPVGLFTTKIDLVHSPYSVSDQNWVTTIGCDDIAVGIVNTNRSLSSSCVAYCSQPEDGSGFGFCPGNGDAYSADGCCRAPIPRGSRSLEAQITDLREKWLGSRSFSCSYAFVEEKGSSNQSGFRYPFSVLKNPTAFQGADWPESIPRPVLRMDWRVGSENCSEALRNSSSYACEGNSVCVDFDPNIGGYLCNCSQGYQGNPYLTPGCIDINECGDGRSNPCHQYATCTNTPGDYYCTCLDTYYGDGMEHSTGCIQVPRVRFKIINVLIGLGSGFGFLLLLPICFWLHKVFQKRKKRMHKEQLFRHLLLQHQTNEDTLRNTKLFPAKELEKATDHFNESRILGQGGQGIVYKGMLSDGKIVAIKKLKQLDDDQMEQFINEIVILSQINHRNVVKLLGCCLEKEVPLLVYEFLPNGNLFELIHNPDTEFPLSWKNRVKIAADIAGALSYLHSSSSIPIYHRDIKSSNILLDEKYVVKVSDFGTSKSVALDQTHVTTLVKGTFGYLDPEYFQTSQFTDKSDVYSFGVVIVELLTKERPINMSRTEGERNLATRFLACMEGDDLDAILDAQVCNEGRKEEVIAVARLAQKCLHLRGRMRPSMKELATELESFRMSELMPSSVENESNEVRVYEGKPMMISDVEYTWTNSSYVDASIAADTRPFMIDMENN